MNLRKNRQDGAEPLWKRIGAFLGRQGFYLVLFLCVGVIGLTALVALVYCLYLSRQKGAESP